MAQAKQTRWMVAQDTFSTDLASGASWTVHKGETYPEGHELVKLDAGRGVLFQPLDEADEAAPPAKVRPGAAKGAS
jgi:hypothetical protein